MKQLLFLIFLSISSFLFGQKSAKEIFLYEKNLVDSVSNKFDLKNPDFKPLKELAKTYPFQSCLSHSYAYRSVAYNYSHLYKDGAKYTLKQEYLDLLMDSTLLYYDLGKSVCKECSNATMSEKLDFLAKTNHSDIYNAELQRLKKLGYKEDFGGLSFGISSQFGKSQWLGLNFSPTEFVHPSNNKFMYGKKYTFFADWTNQFKVSIFNFEVLQNLNKKETDFNFSLLKISAPFHIDITKFGMLSSKILNTSYGYYRPEIGFGYKYVSFGYSYNLIFKKSARKELESSLFFVKLSYPLLKFNGRD